MRYVSRSATVSNICKKCDHIQTTDNGVPEIGEKLVLIYTLCLFVYIPEYIHVVIYVIIYIRVLVVMNRILKHFPIFQCVLCTGVR